MTLTCGWIQIHYRNYILVELLFWLVCGQMNNLTRKKCRERNGKRNKMRQIKKQWITSAPMHDTWFLFLTKESIIEINDFSSNKKSLNDFLPHPKFDDQLYRYQCQQTYTFLSELYFRQRSRKQSFWAQLLLATASLANYFPKLK